MSDVPIKRGKGRPKGSRSRITKNTVIVNGELFDVSTADPISWKQIYKALMRGETPDEIVHALEQERGMKRSEAVDLVNARLAMIKEWHRKQTPYMVPVVTDRWLNLYKECLDRGTDKALVTASKCLDALSKIYGAYEPIKHEVDVKHKFDGLFQTTQPPMPVIREQVEKLLAERQQRAQLEAARNPPTDATFEDVAADVAAVPTEATIDSDTSVEQTCVDTVSTDKA